MVSTISSAPPAFSGGDQRTDVPSHLGLLIRDARIGYARENDGSNLVPTAVWPFVAACDRVITGGDRGPGTDAM